MSKFVFVTGGVVSGLGKGIVAASLGRLLKMHGISVAVEKLDPYMNVDPGTMNPIQHGEVFVTDDGAETDLDLGHYERFIDISLNKYSNLTSGKVFSSVIEKERKGEYLGKTVQIIPHVTDETVNFILKNAELTNADVVITEIGGTIGDIESQHFLEAIRQLAIRQGRENCVFIHVCLVPFISGSDEYKSKPTQHSVKELQSMGISPDIIVTRSKGDIGEDILRKIALFCNVDEDCVIQDLTVSSIYETPIMLHKGGLDKQVMKKLKLRGSIDTTPWKELINSIHNRDGVINIALVGKYTKLHDAYLSVNEALYHGGFACGKYVKIDFIDCETITEDNVDKILKNADGIIVPGGFGSRGIENMIIACKYARENDVPYFGICLGMQIAVMEYARNVCGLEKAISSEFNPRATYKVIDLLPEQRNVSKKGGTMRLGAYPCHINKNTKMYEAYKQEDIEERHRHRYEFNNDYLDILTKNGLIIAGTSPDGYIVEAIEHNRKYFSVSVQFHPEFKSRPNHIHPLFREFILSALEYSKTR